MEKIRVIIENKQKNVKIPTGMRMLVRRTSTAHQLSLIHI